MAPSMTPAIGQARRRFPFEITPVDPDTNTELLEFFHGERTGFVQVGPEKYFFPQKYKDEAEAFYNFQARASDVWVATFPRSGTTWTQEMVWLIANNLDFNSAMRIPLTQRFPFFEFSNFLHPQVKRVFEHENAGDPDKLDFIEQMARPGYEALENVTSQRFIKTHFPFSLLPPSIMEQQSKVIYVARNPKDVAVSYYHLNRLYRTQGFVGDFKQYWNFFERNLNPWMPYWSHIKEALDHRDHPNVLFLFYEDIVCHLEKTLHKIASFLGKEINDERCMENLLNHLKISNFKNNPAVNGQEMSEVKILKTGEEGFVRNGRSVDGWQSEYTEELRERAERWISEGARRIGIEFPKCGGLN